MKILIAIDVFHPHDDLVEHVGWLLPLQDSDITLLFVKEILPSYERVVSSVADFPDDWTHRIESKAESVFDALKKRLESRGAKVKCEIVSGPPAYMISQVAKDEMMDVTVVAPWRHSKIEDFLLGSTSSKVVEITPGVNMVLRDNPQHDKLTHVVFAVDGSDHATRALTEATKALQLKERKITATVLNVVSVPAIVSVFTPAAVSMAVENNLRLEAEKVVADALKCLSDLGVEAEPRVEVGDPASRILRVAEEENAQLVISGAKGHGAVEHLIMGTVADRVVKHAKSSVAIVN